MGYTDITEAGTTIGSGPAPGITSAARLALETEIWFVASSAAAPITITDGNILVIDTASIGGSVRSRTAKLSSATTDIPVGVAFLDREAGTPPSITIPQTTAAGDLMVPVKVMRRGFHNAVSVSTGGAANNVVGCFLAVAGRGAIPVATSALIAGVQEANLVGVTLGAAAGNLAPMWVCCQFG